MKRIGGDYTIKILKNGAPYSKDGTYTAIRKKSIILPAGETAQIEICFTEIA